MSALYDTREMTELDLKLYLNSIQSRVDNYKARDLIEEDPYNREQIRKLDEMAVEALDKYHNQ